MRNDTLNKINEVLRQMNKPSVNVDDDFDKHGILDSIEMIDFFLSIEKLYDINISDKDIIDMNLSSVSSLISYLDSLNT